MYANDPPLLNKIRVLLRGKSDAILFNTADYTHQLERSYLMMWERYVMQSDTTHHLVIVE